MKTANNNPENTSLITPSTSSMGSKDERIIIAQQLKMQFHGTRKGDLETIDSYVKKLKSTADSLTAIGNPISDPDLVLQLLAGLPPSQYLLLKNTISSQLPLPNFSDACSMLYEYEKTISTLPPTTTPGVAAENSHTCKSTVEMIHDIASSVTTVASMAQKFWNVIGPWSGSSSSGTPAKATPGPGNKNKGSRGRGRGNNSRGRGRGGSSSRNSAPK